MSSPDYVPPASSASVSATVDVFGRKLALVSLHHVHTNYSYIVPRYTSRPVPWYTRTRAHKWVTYEIVHDARSVTKHLQYKTR
jgi:hypothetical protein